MHHTLRWIASRINFGQDEKDEEFVFSFDIVFYEQSEQADVYQFLALPVIRGKNYGILTTNLYVNQLIMQCKDGNLP